MKKQRKPKYIEIENVVLDRRMFGSGEFEGNSLVDGLVFFMLWGSIIWLVVRVLQHIGVI